MFPKRLGIEAGRKQALLEFQKQAFVKFKDLRLLNLAFHHRSFSNEYNKFHENNGRGKKAILADALEAVIGAYYLDSGFKPVQKFVLHLIEPIITLTLQKKYISDYKSLLQELMQKNFKTVPKYELERVSGPDHSRTFWFSVIVNEKRYGPLSGKTKKEAEQAAAKLAYDDFISLEASETDT